MTLLVFDSFHTLSALKRGEKLVISSVVAEVWLYFIRRIAEPVNQLNRAHLNMDKDYLVFVTIQLFLVGFILKGYSYFREPITSLQTDAASIAIAVKIAALSNIPIVPGYVPLSAQERE